MARLKHKPDHPLADKNGWVEEEAYYEYNRQAAYLSEDKSYTIGNQKVNIGYIPDEMAPTRHMADGKMYTSKRKYRSETRAHGCIEVGNERFKPRKEIQLDRGQRREHIRRAIYELKNPWASR